MGGQDGQPDGTGGALAADAAATTRRKVLTSALAAAAMAGTGAWAAGPRAAPGAVRGTAFRLPGSLPYPYLRPGTDTIPQIKHIVVLMMENHSYDNHLGMLRRAGADGLPLGRGGKPKANNPYPDGRIQHAFRMPTTCQLTGKPSQTWHDAHAQLAGGHLTGFVRSASGPVAMGYWEKSDLPFYYSLASTFPIADRYFCSVLGPTFPNRRYLMAGTSMGMINDTVPNPFHYPAGGTIFDKLHDAGVSSPTTTHRSIRSCRHRQWDCSRSCWRAITVRFTTLTASSRPRRRAHCPVSASWSLTTAGTRRRTRRTSPAESSSLPR